MKNSKLLITGCLSIGLLLAGCGSKKVDNQKPTDTSTTPSDPTEPGNPTNPSDPGGEPQGEWREITYAQLKADYNAKEEAPWNHVEMQYGDSTGVNPDGSLQLYKVVEDLVESQWVVDTTQTEGGITSDVAGYFGNMINQTIESAENPPEYATAEFYKHDDGRYKIVTAFPYNESQIKIHLVTDHYFYGLEFIQRYNEQKVLECYSEWSVK